MDLNFSRLSACFGQLKAHPAHESHNSCWHLSRALNAIVGQLLATLFDYNTASFLHSAILHIPHIVALALTKQVAAL